VFDWSGVEPVRRRLLVEVRGFIFLLALSLLGGAAGLGAEPEESPSPSPPPPTASPAAPATERAPTSGTTAETTDRALVRSGAARTLFPSGEEAFPPFESHQPRLVIGERLTYSIRCLGMPAGQATLEVAGKEEVAGRSCIRVAYLCRSNRFASRFYKVLNSGGSLIDAAEGYSHRYTLSREEGPNKTEERIEIDPLEMIAYHECTRPGGEVTSQAVLLPGKVHDPLSCLYAVRDLDLAPGRTAKITVAAGGRNWVLALEVLAREEIDVSGLGPRSALKIRPIAAFPGLFVRKGGLLVWLDEETKVPLLMTVDIPIGAIKVSLGKFENSPLNSPADESGPDDGVSDAP